MHSVKDFLVLMLISLCTIYLASQTFGIIVMPTDICIILISIQDHKVGTPSGGQLILKSIIHPLSGTLV